MNPPAGATVVAPEPLRCPSCLAVHEPDQRYCLECGAPLQPPRARLRRGSSPLDPLMLSLAVVALLAAGIGVVWAVGPDDDAGEVPFVATAAVTTAPAGSATAVVGPTGTDGAPGGTDTGPAVGEGGTGTAPPAGTDPVAGTGATTDAEPAAPTTPSATGEEPTDDWPPGRDGWAVILISEERDEHTDAEMEALRTTAERRGLSDVGLLLSDDYATLNPGYRVLYQGPFDTAAEARAAAVAAKREGYASAYPRRVAD